MTEYIGGYRFDLERREDLAATAIDFRPYVEGLFSAPEEVDPRPFIKVENQGPVGSCQGHALSSVVEWCYRIATGGEMRQFSRAFGYYGTQKIDGLLGRDVGSTIDGGRRLAQEYGLPPEEVWPYNGRYDPNPPGGWQKVYEAAAPFKIRSHAYCRSYDDVFNYIASAQGGVEAGIMWGLPNAPVIESYREGRGGHAVAFLGYSKRKDSEGRNYLWMLNSWDTTWGNGGWSEVAPRAVDQMAEHRYTVLIGMSELTTPKPRMYDFLSEGLIG